jgi:hypothetical protein
VPNNTISIGRGARLRPPPSGAPSITTAWPEPVSAKNDMPPGPVQLTLHSIIVSPSESLQYCSRVGVLPWFITHFCQNRSKSIKIGQNPESGLTLKSNPAYNRRLSVCSGKVYKAESIVVENGTTHLSV